MPQATGVFSPALRAITIGILVTITAVAIEGMAVATVMPSVAQDLGGLDAYGWAFSAFMLASLVGAISAGQLSDRHKLRLPAVIGFACFSAGLMIATAAPAWSVLLVARAVQGFGAGCLSAISYVAVARAYPEPLRPRLMALLSSAWVVPALVGPAIAGQVAEHFSWRLVFLGILPPVAVGAGMLLPSLARLPAAAVPAAGVGGGARLFAALRLTAGVALVLAAASMPVLGLAAVVAVIGFLLAAPALNALLPPRTLALRRGLPSAVALRGLLAFGFFGTEALIPLGLSTQRGLSPSLVGIALTAGALAWVLGSWVQDRAESLASGSLGARAWRAATGLVLIVAGLTGVAAIILNPDAPVVLAAAAWAVAGLGMGLAYPATTLTALGLAQPGEEGSAASSLQVAETVGVAVGAGAVGALFALASYLDRTGSDGLLWGFVLTLLAIIVGIAPALHLSPTSLWADGRFASQLGYFCRPARWRVAAAMLLRKGQSTQ